MKKYIAFVNRLEPKETKLTIPHQAFVATLCEYREYEDITQCTQGEQLLLLSRHAGDIHRVFGVELWVTDSDTNTVELVWREEFLCEEEVCLETIEGDGLHRLVSETTHTKFICKRDKVVWGYSDSSYFQVMKLVPFEPVRYITPEVLPLSEIPVPDKQ